MSLDTLAKKTQENANYLVDSLFKNFESQYERFHQIRELPQDKHVYLNRKLNDVHVYLSSLKKIMSAYSQKTEEHKETVYRLMALEPTNIFHKGGNDEYKELSKKNKTLQTELRKYGSGMRNMAKKIKDLEYSLDRDLKKYEPKKHDMSGHEKAVMIAIVGTFSGVVLWTLSQINPGNTAVGAFIAGYEGSPVLLAFATSVVVLVLFFFTHHKIK